MVSLSKFIVVAIVSSIAMVTNGSKAGDGALANAGAETQIMKDQVLSNLRGAALETEDNEVNEENADNWIFKWIKNLQDANNQGDNKYHELKEIFENSNNNPAENAAAAAAAGTSWKSQAMQDAYLNNNHLFNGTSSGGY